MMDGSPKPSQETEQADAPGAGAAVDRTIVLVGLMGAGKTAVGKRLARRLALPFIDADHEIERAAGCTVTEIFQYWGEPAFRDCERRVIRRLLTDGRQVLSTGGGAFMDPETRALVLDQSIAIWLRADLEVLLTRTSRRNTRPLLNDGDPREILTALMAKRHPIYAQAHLVVDSTEDSIDHTVDQVVAALVAHLGHEFDHTDVPTNG